MGQNISGIANVCIGYNAGSGIKIGNNNVAIGYDSYWDGGLGGTASGDQNTAVGALALFNSTGANLFNNTAIGFEAAQSYAGSGGLFLGAFAGAYEDATNNLLILDSFLVDTNNQMLFLVLNHI